MPRDRQRGARCRDHRASRHLSGGSAEARLAPWSKPRPRAGTLSRALADRHVESRARPLFCSTPGVPDGATTSARLAKSWSSTEVAQEVFKSGSSFRCRITRGRFRPELRHTWWGLRSNSPLNTDRCLAKAIGQRCPKHGSCWPEPRHTSTRCSQLRTSFNISVGHRLGVLEIGTPDIARLREPMHSIVCALVELAQSLSNPPSLRSSPVRVSSAPAQTCRNWSGSPQN